MRVLLLAEAANPEWPSVPLVGYSCSDALRRVVDAHVVTQVRNREALERAGWREGSEFTAIDSEAVTKPLYDFQDAVRRATGLGWTFTMAVGTLSYYAYEQLVWMRFGERIAAHEFDVVHRVTPVSPTAPSLIAARCARRGVPFVLGPLNGGVAWPPQFRDVQHREGEWLSYVRDVYKLMPGYRGTRRGAAAIVVGSQAAFEQMPARYRARCVYVPENAIDPKRFECAESLSRAPREGPLRIAWVGRMVPYKGADMLLEAIAPLARSGDVVVDLIGDGPERQALEGLVRKLGIEDAVTFEGWLEHEAVQTRLREADVFAFPSIREFGGGVVLEAMALGLAPVVVDYAGPAELVTDATGVRVPIGTRGAVVSGFRDALARLAAAPALVRQLGARARERVLQSFTWDAKAAQLCDVYRFALGVGPKPDFGMPFP